MAAPTKDAKPAAKAAGGDKKKAGAADPISKRYEVSGSTIKRKNKSCPKCGPGTFLGEHKDRRVCGTCHYMEKK